MELKRKVLPLKDVKSLRAFNAFHALMLGICMLPEYAHYGLEKFMSIVEAMTPEDQLKVVLNGAKLVELNPEEVKAMVCFCTDKNGVPYTSENVKNLGPNELIEVIVTVSMEILRNIHIDLVTSDEKKKYETSQSISVGLS